MVTRHGYYIARTCVEHGDAEFSARARGLWERASTRERPPIEPAPEGLPQPGTFDGVSIFALEEGKVVHRLIMEWVVRDLPVRER
jgi:hypothetical protein